MATARMMQVRLISKPSEGKGFQSERKDELTLSKVLRLLEEVEAEERMGAGQSPEYEAPQRRKKMVLFGVEVTRKVNGAS